MKLGLKLHAFWLIAMLLYFTGHAEAKVSDKSGINDYRSAEEIGLMEGSPPPKDKRVDRSNALMTPPFNRWAYLHMRQIYPTAGVPNPEKAVKLNVKIDKSLNDIKVPRPNDAGIPTDVKVSMNDWLKETYTDALVVVEGDDIVFEKYFNGMKPDHPHQMMSVTKSFAGLFGLMAVEEGKAQEDVVVSKYVPELKESSAFKDATFGQVLDMTNSMDFSEDYADPNSGIVHYGTVIGLLNPQPGVEYADSIYEYLVTLPKNEGLKHGEVFHYQTPKTDVVNWVTARTTGESFQDHLYKKLWSKLGMEGETYVILDKNANLFAGGGLNAPPHALANFASMMINEGKFNGKQVVPKSVITKLSKGASTEAFSKGPNATGIQGNGDWSYRAQWWVRHTKGKEAFTATGIHGQWIYLDPDRKIGVIKQSSQPVSANDFYTAYDILGIDAIIEHLTKSKKDKLAE